MRSSAWCEAAVPPARISALAMRSVPARMPSWRRSPCFRAPHLRCAPLTRNGQRAMWGRSMALHRCLATRTGVRDSSRCPRSRYDRRARASCGNASAARRLQRGCCWRATLAWPVLARGMCPPRRCTAPRACTRSTATVRSPMLTRCWARRFSIRTCVQAFR